MEAIILAGGRGTRLRDVVPDLPKPMAQVAGRPFMEIILTLLSRQGFRRVVISLGYMAEKVVSHFGGHFAGMELEYVIEDSPLGTGGAVRVALEKIINDHVFVFNGDTYIDVEVKKVEKHWLAHRAPIIVAQEVSNTSRYGRLETVNNRVLGFSEKGLSGPGLINAGCYVLPKNILDEFPCGVAFSLEENFLVTAVVQQNFDVFVNKGQFIDIGIPEDYELAQNKLAGLFA